MDGLESAPERVDGGRTAALFGSPELIRTALPPEHAGEFDAALDAALTAARRTLRLDQPRSILQVWRPVALLNRENPEAARRLVDTTVEARQGVSRPGSASWDELRAESGLQSPLPGGGRRRSWRTPLTSILVRRSRSVRFHPRCSSLGEAFEALTPVPERGGPLNPDNGPGRLGMSPCAPLPLIWAGAVARRCPVSERQPGVDAPVRRSL
ncbi:DUF6247 family protein [Saccharothrix texasensis]|uniref:DUF6247 family protein n=1 Tax=Saccharothrix texasensis TaxID=103734 RepID=UPI0011CD879E|nr:DUF6247 family protein [Saccharothrix texasensis]